MLDTSREILQRTYLYLAGRSGGKTQKRICEKVVCLKCGRADKTLLKLENGKICVDCLKRLKNESVVSKK